MYVLYSSILLLVHLQLARSQLLECRGAPWRQAPHSCACSLATKPCTVNPPHMTGGKETHPCGILQLDAFSHHHVRLRVCTVQPAARCIRAGDRSTARRLGVSSSSLQMKHMKRPSCRRSGVARQPAPKRQNSHKGAHPRAATRATSAPETATTSLIPETIEQMQNDVDFQETQERMARLSQKEVTAREAKKREAVLHDLGVPPWLSVMKVRHPMPPLPL